MYCDIKSEADAATLQEDMTGLANWETTWGMTLDENTRINAYACDLVTMVTVNQHKQ